KANVHRLARGLPMVAVLCEERFPGERNGTQRFRQLPQPEPACHRILHDPDANWTHKGRIGNPFRVAAYRPKSKRYLARVYEKRPGTTRTKGKTSITRLSLHLAQL